MAWLAFHATVSCVRPVARLRTSQRPLRPPVTSPCAHRRSVRVCVQKVESSDITVNTGQSSPSLQSGLKGGIQVYEDCLSSTSAVLQAILEDLASRPDYYINMAGVFSSLILGYIVLLSTLKAVNQFPVLPDALKIVGLGYMLWFSLKYVFSKNAQESLKLEVTDFVSVLSGEGQILKPADDE